VVSRELHIEESWKQPLAEAGLDRFEALMDSTQGQCVSWHDRGQTYRIVLPSGQVVFLKRDLYTSLKDFFTDLLCFSSPRSPCLVERSANQRVASLDIPVPKIIAWGQRRWLGLPRQAVLVMTELSGQPLSKFLQADPAKSARRQALRRVGQTAGKLYKPGFPG